MKDKKEKRSKKLPICQNTVTAEQDRFTNEDEPCDDGTLGKKSETRKPRKIAFFDTKPYDKRSFDEVNEKYGYDIVYYHDKLSKHTADLTKGADSVCIFVNDAIDKEMVGSLLGNNVKLVALRCAGYNNVDLKAVLGKIHVVRVPAYSPNAVAEHTAALLLSLNRKTHKAYNRVREGNFSIDGFLGFDLYGKTAGVIGTGQIGRCFISILKGFGMKVLAYDPVPDEKYAKKENISYVTREEIYKKADVISLHCPLIPKTYHLINDEAIGLMKKGVVMLNTGRGGLIDTKALIAGLKKGIIGAAGLDVYEEESEYFFEDYSSTIIKDDVLARLLTFPNVLVTSHQGFFTKEALHNIASTTLDNVKEFFSGGYLKNEICYRCNKPCRKKQGKRCF
jgi:D-lactate dehydrogenase